MRTELHSEFNRHFSGVRGTHLLVWVAAVVVFLLLLLVAPRTKDPNFIRALAVGWPILLAFVSAWRRR
jgi:hypothetical protein